MVDVSYDHELDYLRDSERGSAFPGLWIVLGGRDEREQEKLSAHELTIAFSEQPITRNLLGRDFFNLFQIGFRERHLKILFSTETQKRYGV